VLLCKWQSSIRIFSQIWWCSKYESKQIWSILSCCRQLRWFFLKYFFGDFYFEKTGNLQKKVFLKKHFSKWRKFATKKNHWFCLVRAFYLTLLHTNQHVLTLI
jgi:hypothetical protein